MFKHKYKKNIFIIVGLFFLNITNLYSINDTTALLVCGDENHFPYEYIDEQGDPAGFNIDIFKAVADVMELKVIIELKPWSVARKQLENGEIDIITGMFYSKERDEKVDFSLPHSIVTHAVFVPKNSLIKSIYDVKGKSIIVENGDIMHDYVIENNLTDNLILAKNQLDALNLLATGKYDCALLSRLQTFSVLEKNGDISDIKTVGAAFSPCEFCFAVQN
ncbi:MAG: transporter substrate-binding domain-containing protein, partial [Bacteroidota bacterium]|nr:transporter substrate-binding domain-containing protein [Bacteroidota bacterium]